MSFKEPDDAAVAKASPKHAVVALALTPLSKSLPTTQSSFASIAATKAFSRISWYASSSQMFQRLLSADSVFTTLNAFGLALVGMSVKMDFANTTLCFLRDATIMSCGDPDRPPKTALLGKTPGAT